MFVYSGCADLSATLPLCGYARAANGHLMTIEDVAYAKERKNEKVEGGKGEIQSSKV